jgi:hypothetical protein
MSLEHTLDALLSDATPALRGVLRRAYELGYREALAGQPAPAAPASEPTTRAFEPTTPAPPAPMDEEDLEPEDAPPSVVGGAIELESSPGVQWGPVEEAPPERAPPPVARPIFPHATVGTLRQRIVAAFDLERFDIDIVVCRKGDRARRQLKQTVKLSKYLVGE